MTEEEGSCINSQAYEFSRVTKDEFYDVVVPRDIVASIPRYYEDGDYARDFTTREGVLVGCTVCKVSHTSFETETEFFLDRALLAAGKQPTQCLTRNCGGCKFWSEMLAQWTGGGPIEAMCLAPAGKYRGEYTIAGTTCDRWESSKFGVIDDPKLQDPL